MEPEESGEPPSKRRRRSRRDRRAPKRFIDDVAVKPEPVKKKSTRRRRSRSRKTADDDDFLDDSDVVGVRKRPKRKRRRKKPPPPEVDPTHFLGYFADETSIEEIEQRFAALEVFRKKKQEEAEGEEKAKAEERLIAKLNVKGEGPDVLTDGSSQEEGEGQLSQDEMVEFYNRYGGRDERTHKDIVFEYELNQINEDEGEMDPEDNLFANLYEEEDRLQEEKDQVDMLEYDKAVQQVRDDEDERLGRSERRKFGRRGWRRRGHKGKLPKDMAERRLRFKDPFFNPRVPGIGYSRPSLPKFSPRIRKLHDAPMSVLIKKGRPFFPGPTRRRTVIDFNKWWALLSQGLGTRTVCEEKGPEGFPTLKSEIYLGKCPDVTRYKNWYFHPKVSSFNFKAIFKQGLNMVYCTPPWKSKKFTVADFAELPWDNSPESAFIGGYLFIWIPNDIFQDVWKVLRYKFGFYYCESLTWIKIGPDMLQYGFDADPYSNTHGGQHGVAGEVLYLYRKNVHVKRDDCMRDVNPGVFIDAEVPPPLPDKVSIQASIYRHQRMPDCFFDSTVPFDHPHWYVFRLMNDLLPSLFKPDVCAWLWPDPMCVFTSIEEIYYIEEHFVMIAQNNTFPEQADPTDLNAFLQEQNKIALSLGMPEDPEDGDDAEAGEEEEMQSAGDDD